MGQEYLMDTNTVIDFFNGSLPQNAKDLIITIKPIISVITQIELFCSNNIQLQELLQLQAFIKVATVYKTIDDNIVNLTINIRKTHTIKTPDAIIAATALANDLCLMTRNSKDFQNIANLKIVNPHML